MSYKRILTIQDISCVGQCSLTVALPILSASGLETCILPSAVLSTHTGGFKGYTFRDLTDDIPGIADHWESEGIKFDAVYSGYLGSARQIEHVKDITKRLSSEGGVSIADPAMADNGRLYAGFDRDFVEAMKGLVFSADIILPNITEACMLTGTEYRETYDRGYIDSLLDALESAGASTVILTGVSFTPGTTGVMVDEKGARSYYEHRRIAKGCHGTGDIFASAFVGAMMGGRSLIDSAKIAADYTVLCIERTQGDPGHWYGVKFEQGLPDYIRMLGL